MPALVLDNNKKAVRFKIILIETCSTLIAQITALLNFITRTGTKLVMLGNRKLRNSLGLKNTRTLGIVHRCTAMTVTPTTTSLGNITPHYLRIVLRRCQWGLYANTTLTAKKTSVNKRLNEQNNAFARAWHL